VNAVEHGAEDASVQALLALGPTSGAEAVFDTRSPDTRNARTRVQTCALFALSPHDAKTGVAVDVAKVAEQKPSALVRVVGDDLPSELAGRIVHPVLPRTALVRLLLHADDATLRSHLIDDDGRRALARGQDAEFLSLRRAALDRYLRTYTARMAAWGADDSPPLASLAAEEDD
jgi:hypothetical protein